MALLHPIRRRRRVSATASAPACGVQKPKQSRDGILRPSGLLWWLWLPWPLRRENRAPSPLPFMPRLEREGKGRVQSVKTRERETQQRLYYTRGNTHPVTGNALVPWINKNKLSHPFSSDQRAASHVQPPNIAKSENCTYFGPMCRCQKTSAHMSIS